MTGFLRGIAFVVFSMALSSCVTEQVVDDGNEVNRLIEEESPPVGR